MLPPSIISGLSGSITPKVMFGNPPLKGLEEGVLGKRAKRAPSAAVLGTAAWSCIAEGGLQPRKPLFTNT